MSHHPSLTRVLSLLLALTMLLGTLCACADGAGTAATEGNTATEGSSEATAPDETGEQGSEEATDGSAECELPELDLGGEEYVFLTQYREGWTSGELTVEGLNSDPVNDAVFTRNQVVETQLNVTIRNMPEYTDNPEDVANKLVASVKTGIHEYDVVAAPMYTMTGVSLDGNFRNLLKADYLDLEKPWWTQGLNEALEYQGMQFIAAGSALLSLYRFSFATMFNKGLFDGVGIPYLYENVRDKTWTLDYQNSIIETFYVDNGNGVQDKTGDIYGFVSNDNISVDPYWSSCNMTILGRDEDGDYTLADFDIEKLATITEKVMQLFYGHDQASYDFKYRNYDSEQDDIRDMFAGGYAAMATLRIMALESGAMQNMAQLYGVVPMPKYDTAQENYGTMVHDVFTTLAIPATAADDRFQNTGALLEALAYQGHTVVRPAYYDVALRTKMVTDPDSSEMLDILFESIRIDPGILYSVTMARFHDSFRKLIKNKDDTVASTYKAKTKEAEKVLSKKIVNKLNKLAKKEA